MTWLRPGDRVLCVGHRGAPALAPENTLDSFRAAAGLGVDLVELDVSALRDGTLVVAHSLDLAELTGGAAVGHAGDVGLADLRRLVPSLPTLEEALDLFAGELPGVGVHLDLKAPLVAARVATAAAERGLSARTVVSSTDPRALRAARDAGRGAVAGITYPHDRHGVSRRPGLAPLVAAGLRCARAGAPVRVPRLAAAAGAGAAFVHHALVTPRLLRALRSRDLAVLAWTVDDPAEVDRLRRLGVDGVISNDPAMVVAMLSP